VICACAQGDEIIAGSDRDGDIGESNAGAVAQLAIRVVTPAIDLGVRDATRVAATGCDAAEGKVARDGDRGGADYATSVTELTRRIVTPAVGLSSRAQGAGVRPANRNRVEPNLSNGRQDRLRAGALSAVPELSL
jgi:hypothetical protein